MARHAGTGSGRNRSAARECFARSLGARAIGHAGVRQDHCRRRGGSAGDDRHLRFRVSAIGVISALIFPSPSGPGTPRSRRFAVGRDDLEAFGENSAHGHRGHRDCRASLPRNRRVPRNFSCSSVTDPFESGASWRRIAVPLVSATGSTRMGFDVAKKSTAALAARWSWEVTTRLIVAPTADLDMAENCSSIFFGAVGTAAALRHLHPANHRARIRRRRGEEAPPRGLRIGQHR